MNSFDKIFNEWLWDEKKDYNPFTRYLSERSNDMPDIKEDVIFNSRDLKQHLDPTGKDYE